LELAAIACNNCGAPLHIPDGVNFVTCNHCGSQLAVKRNESVVYTERLEKLEGRTNSMVDEIRQLRIQQELNQADDDWESEKQNYMIRSKNGSGTLPDEPGAIMGPVTSGIGLIVLAIAALTIRDGSSLVCLPMLFLLGITGWVCFDYFTKLNNYRQAQANYYQRRADIEQKYNNPSSTYHPTPVD
jgi:hypothetical protein